MKRKIQWFLSLLVLLHCSLAFDIYSHHVNQKSNAEIAAPDADEDSPVLDNLNSRSPCVLRAIWACGEQCLDSLNNFKVYWQLSGSEDTDSYTANAKENFYDISNLLSNESYTVSVSSVKGEEEYFSNSLEASTDKGEPKEVTGLKAEFSYDTVTLQWDKSKNDCPIKGYYIEWTGVVNWEDQLVLGSYLSEGKETTTFTIRDLVPDTEYTFTISEFTTDEVVGEKSAPVTDTTDEGAPGAPLEVTSSTLNDSSVEVKWSPPSEPNGHITGYHISCQILPDTEDHCNVNTGEDEFYAEITDLLDCGDYTFKVQAINGAGQGEEADHQSRTDPKKPPPNMESFEIEENSKTATSANLTWTIPDTNCPVLYYILKVDGDVLWKNENDTYQFNIRTEGNSYFLDDLIPYTNYSLTLTAETEGGETDPFPRIIETEQDKAGPPEFLNSSTEDASTVNLYWSPPIEKNGLISGYQISCRFSPEITELCEIPITTKVNEIFPITDLKACGEYTFRVQAINEFGEGSQENTVSTTLSEAPPNINGEIDVEAGSTYINISFTPIDTLCPFKYIILGVGDIIWSDEDHVVSKTLEGGSSTYVIDELIPYTSYNFNITATSDDGSSNTKSFTAQTEKDVPSQPTNVKNDSISTNEVVLSWDLPNALNGDQIMGYKISYHRFGIITGEDSEIFLDNDTTSSTIKNLLPCQIYSIDVSANNSMGYGPPQNVMTTLLALQPPVVNNLICEVKDSKSIELSWSIPKTSCKIQNYQAALTGVTNWRTDKPDFNKTFTSINSYTITELIPDTNYNITLSAATSEGFGEISKPCNSVTEESEPEKPQELSVSDKSKSSITIRWKPPIMKNGVIKKYHVYKADDEIYSIDLENDESEDTVYTYEINDLNDGDDYKIYVRAENGAGIGAAADLNTSIDASHLGAILGTVIPLIVILIAVVLGVFYKSRSSKKKDKKKDNSDD